MALEWLESIKQAEAAADKLRADAAVQAHEIVKSVKEASLAGERSAAVELRAEYQARMTKLREETEKAIAAQASQKQSALGDMRRAAEARIPQAARLVAERILRYGDR